LAATLFKDTTYSVQGLVEDIARGEVALPDIQRPFVWPTTKVRDLFDSMYKGFPVGYLLFWATGAEAGARQIGTVEKQAVPRLLIVDGQQRLTSLFAVMTATRVMRHDYTEAYIQIAFRPSDGTFAVSDAAIKKDPAFVPDISVLWDPDLTRRKSATRTFFQRLEAKAPLEESERYRLEDAIDRLQNLRNYPFKVVELSHEVDEERVAEVFVRINSEGVTLNQADFILTLMSVFWEKGRQELEEFCRASRLPAVSGASPFNWFISPKPAQMLRVTVALAFRRAVLRHVYSLLRGKDLHTGKTSTEARDQQFARLEEAQEKVLDLTNWHEFLQCLERAGFRSAKMITSDNVILYSYALWLIGRVDFNVPLDRLREIIARWFFMAATTSRYSGSFETQFEEDAARLNDLPPGDPDTFADTLVRIVNDTLTSDFWTITLPNDLATSASKSPALMAYIAALNILDADALLSTGKVRSRLDPAIIARKGIERHHLFPRNYLRHSLGIRDTRQINQIANMALVEWSDNIAISDLPPTQYWPDQLGKKRHQLSDDALGRQAYWHALPDGWPDMDYQAFLAQRRRRMALVVQDAFKLLSDVNYRPTYPTPRTTTPEPSRTLTYYGVRLGDLVTSGLLPPGAVLTPSQADVDGVATLTGDGVIDIDGETYDTPSAAGYALKGAGVNGWTFWLADTPDGQRSLAELRDQILDVEATS
jgi:hypothetical protein